MGCHCLFSTSLQTWWDVRRRVIEWRVKPPVTTNLSRFTVTLNLYETKLNVLYCRLCRCFFHILDWQSIKATFCHEGWRILHTSYVLDVRTRFIENRHLTSINLSGVSGNGTAIVCMFTMYMCGAGYCLPGLKWVVKAVYTVCTRSLSTPLTPLTFDQF